ncbi:MAG TPA: tripartite tricarboxylate transporter substrate binding protein [Casimicrobiaceae bacterium]|nr:tripartite tricarboxylate transporter substrate binding protein [Casimicrobiaceae bacterium]
MKKSIFLVLLFAAAQALAQGYPTRPIRLVVPFAPGGAADLTARTLGDKMGQLLGQPVLVENKAGANGVVGIDYAAKSPADGYTLLLTDRGSLAVNPSLYIKLPYDPLKDFAYVGIVTDGPYVLVANPKLGVSTVKELVALSKAKPGTINYASYGVGSMAQLNLEAFNHALGTDMVHVPYKGAGPAAQATVAGDTGVTIAAVPAVQGFIKEGRLKALAVGSDKRFAVLPDVPTMSEAGASNDILIPTYFALLAPAGTPPAIVARLNTEMKAALADPAVAERLASAGLVPDGSTPDAMAQSLKRDVPRFAELVKKIGIKPE